MEKLLEKMPLLKSPRFWAIVIAGVIEALRKEGLVDEGIVNVIASTVEMVVLGAAGVKTLDRFSEKVGK